MKCYKITFYTKPKLSRYPDNPAFEQIRYYKGSKAPDNYFLVNWYQNNLEHGAPQDISTKVEVISNNEFEKNKGNDEIFF